jgi:hypothetical protein
VPLDETDTIDAIAEDDRGERARLLLLLTPTDYELEDFGERFREKLNNYVAFALEGEMHEQFGLSQATIVITAVGDGVFGLEELVATCGEALKEYGVDVELARVPELTEAGDARGVADENESG